MKGGQLRQRVIIKEKSVTQNTYGEEVITWNDVDTVWAAVEPLRGREFMDGKQITAEVSTKIRIRYRSGITPEMRAVFGSIAYDIHSIIHIEEREREIHLMCQEIL